MFDPDRSVVDAIRLVFDMLPPDGVGEGGGEMDAPREHRAAVPSAKAGRPNGEAETVRFRGMPQVGRILRNPSYAGAYVYGRKQVKRRADGSVTRCIVMPMEDWHACIPDAHVGLHRLGRVSSQSSDAENATRAAFLSAPARAPRRRARGRRCCSRG